DDEFVVFPDIKPAAKHHYLVVTQEHIQNVKHIIGRQVLSEKGADLSDVRFGFHWPPFNSIQHLHLHAISPASNMGFIARQIFRPGTWWFVTPDYVLSRL
ncbi:Histidine triad nucleotide-binding protein 3, partial [Blattella germanica]